MSQGRTCKYTHPSLLTISLLLFPHSFPLNDKKRLSNLEGKVGEVENTLLPRATDNTLNNKLWVLNILVAYKEFLTYYEGWLSPSHLWLVTLLLG